MRKLKAEGAPEVDVKREVQELKNRKKVQYGRDDGCLSVVV